MVSKPLRECLMIYPVIPFYFVSCSSLQGPCAETFIVIVLFFVRSSGKWCKWEHESDFPCVVIQNLRAWVLLSMPFYASCVVSGVNIIKDLRVLDLKSLFQSSEDSIGCDLRLWAVNGVMRICWICREWVYLFGKSNFSVKTWLGSGFSVYFLATGM